MSDDILVHIGYAKVASTTLQKQLFNKHPSVRFMGIYPVNNIGNNSLECDLQNPYFTDPKIKSFFELLNHSNQYSFDEQKAIQLRDAIMSKYHDNSKLTVFSDERFSSVFFSFPDYKIKLKRLYKLFPDAKILIMIRNQMDIICSQYRDHPFDPRDFHNGKPVSIEKWIDLDLSNAEFSYLRSLKYDEMVYFCKNLFGVENVEVFPLEEWLYSFDDFIYRISYFMGIEQEKTFDLLKDKRENSGVSARYNRFRNIRRKISPFEIQPFIPRFLLEWIKKGKKHKVEINNRYKDYLDSFFEESNKNLIEQTGIDLKRYDYPGLTQ